MHENPWQTHASKPIYDNPWISVTEHQVTNPGGGPGIYGVVSFKNIATGIVPLDEHQYTWLVGQHRYPLDAWSWEIPEGGGALDTDPLRAAQRELREETGLRATRWDHLAHLHLSNCVSNEVAHIYLARDLTHGEACPDEDEALELRRLPFAEALTMVANGKITDAVSVVGLLRARDFLENISD